MDIKQVLSEMTLEEKALLCSGLDAWHTKEVARLGVPSVMMADGPHGLRKEKEGDSQPFLKDSYPSTCFPTASTLASTWNRELIGRIGAALGEECLAAGVSVILGPGVNIKRSPLCGRNFEYFSEDPYLSGEMAIAMIRGTQSKGVGSSLKHFAANNQEYRRMLIDAVIDARTLREIYLAGFEKAVRQAKPWTVMAAYNKVNGVYCTEHTDLLTKILRDEWGYKGIVISDWGAVDERLRGLSAGMDLEMPGVTNDNSVRIEEAVRTGALDETILDTAVERLLRLVDRSGKKFSGNLKVDIEAHHALAKKAAGEGAVLLKNENSLLPLRKDMKVAIVGAFAVHPRYQGSGSSLIHPSRLDTMYDEMIAIAGKEQIHYAPGYSLTNACVDKNLIAEAVWAAEGAEAVVVCVGLTDMDEVEGVDREHMRLPNGHNRLIEAVVKANPHTIVLLSNGSPVEMPWIGKVPAVLEGYLGGQAGAGAHAALLYGETNPSGKLAESFPVRLEDNPSFPQYPGGPRTVEYRESIYVGYRFYDSVSKEVLFPFGHGLSYTTFAYSSLKPSKKKIRAEDGLSVTFNVKNTGKVYGKETAQVYVRDIKTSVFRPEKELKGFTKVDLHPGEEKAITIKLDKRAFAFFDIDSRDWVVETGTFEILVGTSSRDIRLHVKVGVTGNTLAADSPQPVVYAQFPTDARVSKADFETLLDRAVPDDTYGPRPYSLNTSIVDMHDSFIGRILEKKIRKQIGEMAGGQTHNPTRLMIERSALENPLRVLIMFSRGALRRETLEGLLHLANGKVWKGIKAFIKGSRVG